MRGAVNVEIVVLSLGNGGCGFKLRAIHVVLEGGSQDLRMGLVSGSA
jgi:hypothetical protein